MGWVLPEPCCLRALPKGGLWLLAWFGPEATCRRRFLSHRSCTCEVVSWQTWVSESMGATGKAPPAAPQLSFLLKAPLTLILERMSQNSRHF